MATVATKTPETTYKYGRHQIEIELGLQMIESGSPGLNLIKARLENIIPKGIILKDGAEKLDRSGIHSSKIVSFPIDIRSLENVRIFNSSRTLLEHLNEDIKKLEEISQHEQFQSIVDAILANRKIFTPAVVEARVVIIIPSIEICGASFSC